MAGVDFVMDGKLDDESSYTYLGFTLDHLANDQQW
jgi:hypothetical protein